MFTKKAFQIIPSLIAKQLNINLKSYIYIYRTYAINESLDNLYIHLNILT